MARAQSLLCSNWLEKAGTGEQLIPGVRAPDGSVIYLIGRDKTGWNWRDDFLPVAQTESNDEAAPTLEFDHIAEALPSGSMDRFVLFYRAVFGLTAEPAVEFPDRFGTGEEPCHAKRWRGRVTIAAQYLRQPNNGGRADSYLRVQARDFHHIAFQTEALTLLLDGLRSLNAQLLSIPKNYYDDLDASGIAQDLELAELAKAGLMFDADRGGTFRHVYASSFEGRFFIEFVERDGYGGYGANNAAVRVAAQARSRHTSAPSIGPRRPDI